MLRKWKVNRVVTKMIDTFFWLWIELTHKYAQMYTSQKGPDRAQTFERT